jgi:hypothetical protein
MLPAAFARRCPSPGRAIPESLLPIRRAAANFIATYPAKAAARSSDRDTSVVESGISPAPAFPFHPVRRPPVTFRIEQVSRDTTQCLYRIGRLRFYGQSSGRP